MLSFDILTEQNCCATRERLGPILGDVAMTGALLESFLDIVDEGAEVAVTAAHGELLIRIYDEGRYSFVYPIDVGADTDVDAALLELAAYSVKELIPFYLTDTPREELDRLRRLFSHLDARAYDEDEDSFVALVYSECDLLGEVPEISHGGVVLSRITQNDLARYAALCRSPLVNKYWGYDYREDESDATDDYFLEVVESEFARGVALSLAIREPDPDSELLGEAVLFDFDYRGGAKVAVRLLPEHWGRGIGTRALAALIELAREMGLKRVSTEVRVENLPSISMTGKLMHRGDDVFGRAQFSLELV